MDSLQRLLLAALFVCGVGAAQASANPGAAVAFPIVLMAMFGNGLISIIEVAFAKALGARWRAIWLIPIGNYLSMWFGMIAASILFELVWSLWDEPLVGAIPATWIATAVLVLAGFVLEFPFFLHSFDLRTTDDGRPGRWRRALAATILAGVASNLVVAAGIHQSWNHSLLTTLSYPNDPSLLTDAAKHDGRRPWVYAITNEGRTIERFRLDGSERGVVFVIEPPLTADHHIQALQGEDGFDLVLVATRYGDSSLPNIGSINPPPSVLETLTTDDGYSQAQWIKLISGIGSLATVGSPDQIRPDDALELADLSTESDRGYLIGGVGTTLHARPPNGEVVTLVLQNGFIKNAASISHGRLLPDDVLVMAIGQYGTGEPSLGIYGASLRNRQLVRIIAGGRSPVVVYD